MPVIYDFTTEVTELPVSHDWPCADVQGAAMEDLLSCPAVSASRSAPYFSTDANHDLVIYSDDEIPTWLRFSLPITATSTVQIKFKPSQLPHDLSATPHMFVGTYNRQGYGGGVVLSKAGLCVVSGPDSKALPFPGSHEFLEEGEEYYVLRMVAEGSNLSLYLTPEDGLPESGHLLRYTAVLPPTPTGTPDKVVISVCGTSERPSRIKLDSIQIHCSSAIYPNRRPIANPGPDQTVTIGAAVVFPGTQSYDPEGNPVTYRWSLWNAPDGSKFKSSGEDGSAVDDGSPDPCTRRFSAANAFSAANMPLLQPWDALQVDDQYYYVSTERWRLEGGKYVRDEDVWNDSEIVLISDNLPKTQVHVPWSVLHSATFFSSPTDASPYAIPDKSGLYEIALVVNDGELDSLPASTFLNATETLATLGCTPDLHWIWDYLSDFWKLLEDRQVVETVWEGMSQAYASDLLTAWQSDYNKSLLDIQRTFQRRWLSYSSFLEEPDPDSVTIRIVRGTIYSKDIHGGIHFTTSNNTLQIILDSGDVNTVTFAPNSTDPGSPDYRTSPESIAHQINASLDILGNPIATAFSVGGSTYLRLEYATLLRIRPSGTANSALGFSTTAYTINTLQGKYGGPLEPGSAYSFSAYHTTLDPPYLDFGAEGIGKNDLLVWRGQGFRVARDAIAQRSLVLLDALPDADEDPPLRLPWVVGSVIESSINFEEALVSPGDSARFEIKREGDINSFEVDCPILAARETLLAFDPLPLLEAYTGSVKTTSTRFVGVQRVNYIPVNTATVSIPRLQSVLRDPDVIWTENKDYSIEQLSETRVIRFKAGLFSTLNPPPEKLWAEVTYLDNSECIENNFGRLVNLTREQLQASATSLDYLSSVRGLWWSYLGGPTFSKIRTGIQILLGLPFAEEPGTIELIDPDFSATEGRIVVRDTADPNLVRTYYYPRSAGIGTKPGTNEPLKVGDTVDRFDPLSSGIEVKDWISDPIWHELFIRLSDSNELRKYFHFLVRGDVDTFDVRNLLFVVDFVRKVCPHYTSPLFALLKKLTAEVDVSDTASIKIIQHFFDFASCHRRGALIWDDSDGSGHCRNHYDDTPPAFIHDSARLCPHTTVWAVLGYTHPGSSGWHYDTIWAYDDGGGKDKVPLSGPDSSPPPPYGPAVGIIQYDDTVTAGTYHRERNL